MDRLAQQMEKARSVKRRHEKAWLALDGVVSVGVGLSPANEPAVIIGLREKGAPAAARIPAQVDGMPVLLVPTGDITAR